MNQATKWSRMKLALLFGSMTRFTLQRSRLVEYNFFTVYDFDQAMAFLTRNSLVTALQRKLCSLVVVESGWFPALGIVAIRTGSFSGFCELAGVGVFVTILANRGCAFELHLF